MTYFIYNRTILKLKRKDVKNFAEKNIIALNFDNQQ